MGRNRRLYLVLANLFGVRHNFGEQVLETHSHANRHTFGLVMRPQAPYHAKLSKAEPRRESPSHPPSGHRANRSVAVRTYPAHTTTQTDQHAAK